LATPAKLFTFIILSGYSQLRLVYLVKLKLFKFVSRYKK